MSKRILLAVFAAAAGAALLTTASAQSKKAAKKAADPEAIGYEDTPQLPDQKWRVHDLHRPRPVKITPGTNGSAPSDAVVLFNGKDLSQWVGDPSREQREKGMKGPIPAEWKVDNGVLVANPKAGSIYTKEKFGDVQLHIEWMPPFELQGKSQHAGNSGVILMRAYEIQVLESNQNVTYADGQAGAMYGQFPPLVNATRPKNEWQTYDIAFEAPKFEGDKMVKPAVITVFHNGVLIHHKQPFIGRMVHRKVAVYSPHGPEEPLELQGHGNATRFRNIWMRRLKPYDAQ